MTRSAPTAENDAARFIDHDDGTVSDTRRGLMWSKATLNPRETDHASAERLCAELVLAGHSDWRLPTVEELFGLVDRTRCDPAIDTTLFPGTRMDWYWSSTRTAWAPASLWIIYFGNGLSSYSPGNDYLGGFVRAVRTLPPPMAAADAERPSVA